MMRLGWPVIPLALLLAAAPVGGQQTERMQIHGFGTWAYGNTDGNEYAVGEADGRYANAQFALNLAAQPSDTIVLRAQAAWHRVENGAEAEFSYAYGEWRFSDALRLRAGLIQQPAGLYAEILHVGTLQPFAFPPQSIYGPAGMVAEGYQGLGITGSRYLQGGWGLMYDLYSGEVHIQEMDPFDFMDEVDPGIGPPTMQEENVKDAVGGRVRAMTPIDGLRFGFDLYTGKIGRPDGETTRDASYGASAEYLAGRWTLRSEYRHKVERDVLAADAFYAELARKLTDHWQTAVRFDWSDTSPTGTNMSLDRSLLRHKELGIGVNYWFGTSMVMKLSYHYVRGNRFALPASGDSTSGTDTAPMKKVSNLFVLGTAFSF
ncbi:MAG: hypothetical protein HYX75_08080 [Acidobacteria bacterium]|nr:hypothetical protein [Acidobacteriota bacterium]